MTKENPRNFYFINTVKIKMNIKYDSANFKRLKELRVYKNKKFHCKNFILSYIFYNNYCFYLWPRQSIKQINKVKFLY